jgi:hypothetical protein
MADPASFILLKWRRHPESNRKNTALQTVALPLGYAASFSRKSRDPWNYIPSSQRVWLYPQHTQQLFQELTLNYPKGNY